MGWLGSRAWHPEAPPALRRGRSSFGIQQSIPYRVFGHISAYLSLGRLKAGTRTSWLRGRATMTDAGPMSAWVAPARGAQGLPSSQLMMRLEVVMVVLKPVSMTTSCRPAGSLDEPAPLPLRLP